jgi:hypothetical protein
LRENDFLKYFENIEIDLTALNEKYGIIYPNVQPVKYTIKNLFAMLSNVDFSDLERYFDDYIIIDNERPDQLAYKLYEDINLWWVNLVINKISIYDFPLNDDSLYEMVEYLYVIEYKFSREKYTELLTELNENKRNIKVVKPEQINIVLTNLFGKTYTGR